MPKIQIKERDLTTNPLVSQELNYILVVDSSFSSFENIDAPRVLTEDDLTLLPNYNNPEAETADQRKLRTFLSSVMDLGGYIVGSYSWDLATKYCGDRNQYDIKFILAKEKGTVSEEAQQEERDEANASEELQYALNIATKRKDCLIVFTSLLPSLKEKDVELCASKCSYITANKLDFFSDEVKQPQGKYVTAFYSTGIHTNDSNTDLQIDAGQAYILAFLNSINNGNADWLSIAGAIRGSIPGNYEITGFLSEDEIDNMQPRTYIEDHLVAVNPICNMNPWGARIWGNRTCLPNTNVPITEGGDDFDANTDQLVASSFTNIRVLICDIKKAIYRAARRYQFDNDTDILWVNFTSSVNSLLEEIKQSYGITAYRWRREATTERATLRAVLQIVPIECVEDFKITVELSDDLEGGAEIAE